VPSYDYTKKLSETIIYLFINYTVKYTKITIQKHLKTYTADAANVYHTDFLINDTEVSN